MGLNATLGSGGWTVTLDPNAGGLVRVTDDANALNQHGSWFPSLVGLSGASKTFGVGSGGTAISLGTTMVTQHPAEYAFVGAQLFYENQSGSSYTVSKARCASTATHQSIASTETWYDATFSGSASGAVAASPSGSASDTQGSFLLSDFIPVISVARTDDTTKTPLLQVRSYFAAAANGLSVGATGYCDVERRNCILRSAVRSTRTGWRCDRDVHGIAATPRGWDVDCPGDCGVSLRCSGSDNPCLRR
jgi:hypothetical protein